MERARILVLDDDANVLAAVGLILERAGYAVQTTSQVFGLPHLVGQFRPALVLLDFDLPALTGDKLALSLRGLRTESPCKVVFHSAESEMILARAVRDTGAAGFIRKGLPKQDFLARVGSYITT